MDQCVLRLLTVALVFGNLHAALTAAPSDKPGVCPNPKDLPDKCYLVPVCHTDRDCEGNFKCCFNGCGNDCVKPVLCKLGSCPRVQGPGLCVEMCSTDKDCGINMKCCSNGCGHECMQQAPPLPAKPGVCPRPVPHFTTCEDKCCTDYDCDGNKKCCYSGCGMHCVRPRPCRGRNGRRNVNSSH